MPDAFDPYHKWLGIPPAEQPPNHYRLLGVFLFESDLDVIAIAADKQMLCLRSFQTGPHSELSQKLLNEIAAARVCLLHPEKKAGYDMVLREKMAVASRLSGTEPPAPPLLPPPIPPIPVESPPKIGSDSNDVTQEHLDSLGRQMQGLQEAVTHGKRQLLLCRVRQAGAYCHLAYLIGVRFLREQTAKIIDWPWVTVMIASVLVGGLFCILTVSWTGGFCGLIAGGILFGILFYLPSESTLPGWIEGTRSRLAQLRSEWEIAARWLAQVRSQIPPIQEEHQRLSKRLRVKQRRESEQYRRQELCQRNWKALRSHEFEKFLEEVFRELGYSVEMTRVTGDQGADLLVAKAGHRIAIQAKGYLHSVGNDAVQEAYFATAYYKCQACAVITNSRFTSGAKDAAEKSGCVLIDEDQLPALVMGQIDLLQMVTKAKASTESPTPQPSTLR